ncbi:alpha/beta hydrolase [Nostoc sp. 3335mG]|nr:alpha/beta hydrolase [Nostoc sp. 3335mG]
MIETSRRALLAMTGAAVAMPAMGQAVTASEETLPLWPRGVPGSDPIPSLAEKADDQSHDPSRPDRFITGVSQPRLVVHRPARPNGAAVLLMPGGGYGFLSYDNEGVTQARWLNALGITAFILLYRLPDEGWVDRAVVPLQDAQRAMRLIRAHAERFAIRPDRVAALGFSAGGHLAGSLATRHGEAVYAPIDPADALSARPDLAGLLYPVVSLSAPFTHGDSRDHLLGTSAGEAERRHGSVELRIDAATSPCFIVHAGDDGLVPVANSTSLYTALNSASRPAELHVFNRGGHGFGVRPAASEPIAAWPRLFHAFGASLGVFPPATS